MANEETPEMQRLVSDTQEKIDEFIERYKSGAIDESNFEDEMQKLLAQGHMSSYMLGQESSELDEDDFTNISDLVQYQFLFLKNFADVMRTSPEFMDGWFSRAEMYASAFNQTYWTGRFKMLPLPAMPGQGTQCYSNCRCKWDVTAIDEANGDYDGYWVLDPFVEEGRHCQTCLQRADEWNPVRIRAGVLQL